MVDSNSGDLLNVPLRAGPFCRHVAYIGQASRKIHCACSYAYHANRF